MLTQQSGAVVLGGANMDLKAQSSARLTAGTSNPGRTSMTPGGVGRNIAETIARLGDRVHLISAVGRDSLGDELLDYTATAGVNVEYIDRTAHRTGTYTALLDVDGELVGAIADMDAIDQLGPEHLTPAHDLLSSAGILVIDGNVRRDAVDEALAAASGVRAIFEPVSVPKAARANEMLDERIYALTPNRDELAAITDMATSTASEVRSATGVLHARGIELVWVRLGDQGSILSTDDEMLEIPALATKVVDVTGAGDSMLGAFCHALLAGSSAEEAARFGHAAAAVTIESPHTVRPDLTTILIQDRLIQDRLDQR